MKVSSHPKTHEHATERIHVLLQKAAIPYEIEVEVCADCHRIVAEKPVKRLAA